MTRACGNCQWWVESKDRDLKGLGRCRGGPPTTSRSGLGDWPVTGIAEWCGAFRMAEALAEPTHPLAGTLPQVTAEPYPGLASTGGRVP
jgi:hypothetical protein